MTSSAEAVDNDVLIKGASFGLLREMFGQLAGSDPVRAYVLATAKHVVRSRLSSDRRIAHPVAALEGFANFLASASELETTDEEQRLAAELELSAQLEGVQLDVGESQLAAVVHTRDLARLVTGDKRAIEVLERLAREVAWLASLEQRILSLEQLMLRLHQTGVEHLRERVCAEPNIDTTMSICFACSTADPRDTEIVTCLESYIHDLRARVSTLLI